MSENIKKGPSQGGAGQFYFPEFKNDDGIWHGFRVEESKTCGIELAHFSPSPEEIVGLMSYEAALAFIWTAKASSTKARFTEFRVAEYQLTYSIETTETGHMYFPRDKLDLVTPESPED